MENGQRHISWWMSCIAMMMLLLTACSGDDGETTPGSSIPQENTVLTFYVYAPERPMITRAPGDYVSAEDTENAIHSLQIWVFEHNNGNLVGYLEPTSYPTTAEGKVYQMNVSKSFADAAEKPNVDVYVVANFGETPKTQATQTGGTALPLNGETTRTQLDAALIGTNAFGLATPVIGINAIAEGGLPMTGVLRDQEVVGQNPVLRIGETDNMAKVQLTRMVSKVRFVFAKATGQSKVCITGITMNDTMIPDVEYLFSTPTLENYNTDEASLLAPAINDIAETDDPIQYVYNNQEAQDYEDLIDEAASKQTPELTVHGPVYLRESDKKLTGTISYSIDDVEQEPATFTMEHAGEFLRNHTWIVYAYYAGSGKLQIQALYVKNWENKERTHNLYNW